jgi:hypothetical protein
MVGRTVSAIDDDLQASQIEFVGKIWYQKQR